MPKKPVSEPESATVRAGVRASPEHARVGVPADDLATTEERAGNPPENVDVVSLGLHGFDDRLGNALFQHHGTIWVAIFQAGPRCVEGGLGVLLEVHHAGEHLHVALRLHEPAHHAERGPEVPVLRRHGGDDRVVGSLPRLQPVRVLGV